MFFLALASLAVIPSLHAGDTFVDMRVMRVKVPQAWFYEQDDYVQNKYHTALFPDSGHHVRHVKKVRMACDNYDFAGLCDPRVYVRHSSRGEDYVSCDKHCYEGEKEDNHNPQDEQQKGKWSKWKSAIQRYDWLHRWKDICKCSGYTIQRIPAEPSGGLCVSFSVSVVDADSWPNPDDHLVKYTDKNVQVCPHKGRRDDSEGLGPVRKGFRRYTVQLLCTSVWHCDVNPAVKLEMVADIRIIRPKPKPLPTPQGIDLAQFNRACDEYRAQCRFSGSGCPIYARSPCMPGR